MYSKNKFLNSSIDRINKINQKLNNFHSQISLSSNNLENDNNNNTNINIEERLISLDRKTLECQEDINKGFSQAKKELSLLIQNIEEDRQIYQMIYEERKRYIKELENNLMQKLLNEQKQRISMEQRLLNKVDLNVTMLKNEMKKENQNRNESIRNYREYIQEEVPMIIEEMKKEQDDRIKADEDLSNLIDEGFTQLYNVINEEKISRENTEISLSDMIKGIMNRISIEIEAEKKIRDSNEKNLIELLEQTCQKLECE